MRISAATKISQILKSSPNALEAIVSLSPKFKKLENPLLRRVMTPRVTIEQAAKLGGCSISDFFGVLQPLGFSVVEEERANKFTAKQPKPRWLLAAAKVKYLDVRPVLAGGDDPLKLILKEVKELGKGEILCIINTFEPAPLIKLLSEKGFLCHAELIIEGEDIRTYFLKKGDLALQPETPEEDAGAFEQLIQRYTDRMVAIDVRRLEMPQPMIQILESLNTLSDDQALFVHHKRIPVYLLPELNERGFNYSFRQIDEDNVKLLIYKR